MKLIKQALDFLRGVSGSAVKPDDNQPDLFEYASRQSENPPPEPDRDKGRRRPALLLLLLLLLLLYPVVFFLGYNLNFQASRCQVNRRAHVSLLDGAVSEGQLLFMDEKRLRMQPVPNKPGAVEHAMDQVKSI